METRFRGGGGLGAFGELLQETERGDERQRREGSEVERMDLRTHSTHMSVVSGLWAEMDGGRKEGGRGEVMKGGPVFNSARNCMKGPMRPSLRPGGERDRP